MEAPIRSRRWPLFLLFFISGFAGLILEMAWARRLSLLTGSGVRSSATVVAATIAGLALGSRWAGKRADRIARPLRAYALLEAGVALWAFATPLFFRFLPLLLPLLAGRGEASADPGIGAMVASGVLLLPATFLMGATTPFLVRHGSRCWPLPGENRAAVGAGGSVLGALYGWNTLGGAAGSIATVFAFLPWLGLARTIGTAALLDALVAAAVFLIFLDGPGPEDAGASSPNPAAASAGMAPFPGRFRVLLTLAAAGALGGICQLAWTRLLVLFFGSSTHALGLTLSASLAGLASGSVLAGRWLGKGASAPILARRLLLALAGSLALSLFLWGKAPALIVLAQGRLGGSFAGALLLQGLCALVLISPAAATLGALLPVLTALLGGGDLGAGRSAGEGYSLDSWGSVLGAVAGAFLLVPRLGVEPTLRLAGLAALLLVLSVRQPPPRPSSLPYRRAFLPACCAALLLLLPGWDPVLMTSGPLLYAKTYASGGGGIGDVEEAMRRRGPLRFLEEGAEATVAVREGPGGLLSLQINGKTDASTGGDLPTQILAGRLPALFDPSPRRVLVIGLASGATAGALVSDSLERLDCVEISPEVAKAAPLFSAVNGGVLQDPRVHLRLGDGRTYLQRTARRYDLIASQPTNPWIAGVTNLFTREFFSLARDRLERGGVLAVWLQGYSLDPSDFRSAVSTFLQVFPEAQLWEESAAGGDYFLIGRNGGAGTDPGFLRRRADPSREERRDLARAGIEDVASLLSRFVAGPRGLASLSRGAPLVEDDNLRLEFSAPRALWSYRMPELIASLEEIRESPLLYFPAPEGSEGEALRARLAELETLRRNRIRLALSLRQADIEALATPELSAAAGLVRQGLLDAALPFLRAARLRSPGAPALPLLEGWILLGRDEPEAALRAFHDARRLDPASAEAANGEGLAAWRSGDRGRAKSLFEAAATLMPGDPEPLNNLASVLLAEGKEEEAIGLLDQVLARHSRYVPALINRGVALARLGRPGEAAAEYRRALELEPGNEDAAYNLRRALEREADGKKGGPAGSGGREPSGKP